MFKNKRNGVELTMNVLIIAVISLLVLMILAFLLMRGFGSWNTGTQCETQGGKCTDLTTSCSAIEDGKYPVISVYSCKEKGKKCCTNIGGFGDEKATKTPEGS